MKLNLPSWCGPTLGAAIFTLNASASAATGPCDIYKDGGTPCVAAHSTVRALFGSYSGKLYQVRRTDNTTKDILAFSAGGPADATSQDDFCKGTTCVITKVYDQSGKGNDLQYQGTGGSLGKDYPSTATKESFNLGGHKVYSLWIDGTATTSAPGSTTNQPNSYWVDGSKSGVPTGAAPEAVYMVTSGTHFNGGCCFDYGNSETDRKADGAGAMDAIYFGSSCWFKDASHPNYKCTTGSGPWIQADLEYGLFAWNSASSWNPNDVSFTNKYVTAMLKNNGTTKYAMKGANSQSGNLSTIWNGALPPGYNPMKKQGAIILGSGGDCCYTNNNQNMSAGTFYEGAIVSGYPADAVDSAIQANIISAGYGSAVPVVAVGASQKSFKGALTRDPSGHAYHVHYTLPEAQSIQISVVDLQGRTMAILAKGPTEAGEHAQTWEANGVHPGVYILRMALGGTQNWSDRILLGN